MPSRASFKGLGKLAVGAGLIALGVIAGRGFGVARAATNEARDPTAPPTDSPGSLDSLAERPRPPSTATPGQPIVYEPKPRFAREIKACSFRAPICVHAESTVPGPRLLAVLASAESAYATLTGALELPAPDVDPDTLAYDVFLVRGAAAPATHLAARDVRSRVDRARSFTVLDDGVRAGCALDGAVARELARASLYRVAPATDEATALAQTTYLAGIVAPCRLALDADAAQVFQSNPDRAVPDRHVGDAAPTIATWAEPLSRTNVLYGEGASLFWSRIDWAFARSPGGIVRATWALSPTMTELGAKRWDDEPDAFDVLRVTFKNALTRGSTLDDLLLDVAVARAFMGANDDGQHQPETRVLGDAARVKLDWDLPWPSEPKRVAPRAPVAPTGASYIVIHRDGAAREAGLRVEIAWEEHALFRWALVKLDASGRELGRVLVPTRERAVEAQMSFVDLAGVDRLLLVGVNVGDPAYAFDPNDEVWEPHGWLVTLAGE